MGGGRRVGRERRGGFLDKGALGEGGGCGTRWGRWGRKGGRGERRAGEGAK